MMQAICRGAPAALWQSLLREAEKRTGYLLDEHRESYLVFVLLHRQNDPYLLSRIQAISWLHAHQNSGSVREQTLREIGDDCLLIAGLFPGLAQRRRVSVDYYLELGQGAYQAVAETKANDADLFTLLARSYRDLVKTLRALRPANTPLLQVIPSHLARLQCN